jgi:tRNA (guanine-N7-)-methyltransferase
MGDLFLENVARLLEKDGELFVQTDVEERAEQYATTIEKSGLFVTKGEAEGSARIEENPFHARSHREHRAIEDGLPIHRMLYRKR